MTSSKLAAPDRFGPRTVLLGTARIAPLVLSMVAGVLFAGHAEARVYQFDNVSTQAITSVSSDANCNAGTGALNITFAVSDVFTATSIGVGLTIDHDARGEIRAVIEAPDGTDYVLFDDSADTSDDYDILLSSNSDAGEDGQAILDEDDDPVAAPFFSRPVTVAGLGPALSEAANGNWILRLCDRSGGTTGNKLRARLVLLDATTDTANVVCTSRTTFDWGTNNGGADESDFTSVTVGGVTITRTAQSNFGGGTSTGEFANQTTDTSSLGGHTGFYALYMDASVEDGGAEPDDHETLGVSVTFGFASGVTSTPAQDFTFSTLDSDQLDDDFEDIARIFGTSISGVGQRYSRTPAGTPVFQDAGDVLEADSLCSNASNCATENYRFDRPVTAITVEYYAGDDVPSEPGDQVVGISDFSFCAFDFGDAPNTYGTQLAGGARHAVGTRELWMGANRPDGEADGAPAAAATTDDTTQLGGVDDEDGLVGSFAACPGNGTYTVTVSASNVSTTTAGTLVGYIDWNRDGDFDNGTNEESAAVSVPFANADPTNYVLNWSGVTANCGGTTATYARFRLAFVAAEAAAPTGLAASGEVEDYPITASTLPVTVARVESSLGAMLSVRWTTATETANAGFRVWGVYPKGARRLLANVKSQSADSFVPQEYEIEVAADARIAAIEIEDLSLFGERRRHGPFAVGKTFGGDPGGAAIDWRAIKEEAGIASSVELMVAAETGQALQVGDGMRSLAAGARSTSSGALLLVRKEGIHRVTYEQLLAAGVDFSGASPEAIAVLDNGAGVPRFVSAGKGPFGPGSFVEFVARPRLTLASPVDVLVLTVDAGAKDAIPAGALAVGYGRIGAVGAEDAHSADAIYSFASPNGDPWYEEGLLAWGAPATLSRTFDLPDLTRGPVFLDLKAWGYGDFPGTTHDHHIVVKVNGVEVTNKTFDGVSAWSQSVEVSTLVRASGNVLEVVVPGDTGYEYDYVAFDGFTARYSRQAVAIDQRFQGVAKPSGLGIGGYAPGEAITIWKTGKLGGGADRVEQVSLGGLVSVSGAGTVYAAAPGAVFTPAIIGGVPEPLKKVDTEYLIVAHPAFARSLDGLVALEESRGFETEVVTTDRIFAAYSDHAVSAEALKSFLAASLKNNKTLRYVLLVGADTTDPYDHLGLGSISYVPTQYLPFAEYISFSPTDELLVDGNNDGLGDVPIGRLPARTPAELEAMVAKLRNWELNLASAGRNALLVSGASDADGRIATANLGYQSTLPRWNVAVAQVDSQGVAATRAAVLAGLNGGTPLVSFIGHTAPGQWDFTPVLSWQDVATLTDSGRTSLITQWGCWNSYYVQPTWESLSARLLRTPGVGAASTIGATTLTSQPSHELLGSLFFARVNAGATTLGEAFRGAKIDLLRIGGPSDAVLGMTLLGDPAMSLPR